MKKRTKRVLSLALGLILALGSLTAARPSASAYTAANSWVGKYYDIYYTAIVEHYEEYTKRGRYFEDPVEAWDDFIKNGCGPTGKGNNWFPYNQWTDYANNSYWWERSRMPSLNFPNTEPFFTAMASFIECVKPDGINYTGPIYDENGKGTHTIEYTWIMWYDMTQTTEYRRVDPYEPYRYWTFDQFYDYYMVSMSKSEREIFSTWYLGVLDVANYTIKAQWQLDEWWYTFDEWCERNGYDIAKAPVYATGPEEKRKIPTATVQHFSDVTPDTWYYEAINNYAEVGILQGGSDGLFRPTDYITNAEFATILCRISETVSTAYNETVLDHAPVHWGEQAILSANTLMYLSESHDETRTPILSATVDDADKPVTRGDVFHAIYGIMEEPQFDGDYNLGRTNTRYTADEQMELNRQARTAIKDYGSSYEGIELYAMGIIHGDSDGYIHPDQPITRAELCQILYNMGAINNYLDN